MPPLEIVTFGLSFLLSGIMSLWSQSLKASAQRHSQMIEGLTVRAGIVERAREFGRGNRTFEFTRRTLALMSVFSVIVLPKLAVLLFPYVPVMVGYTEWHPGFWFFTDGHDVVKWQTSVGLAITPLDTHFCMAVAGLYFGSSNVKNA